MNAIKEEILNRKPQVGDIVYFSCAYTAFIYPAIIATKHVDDTYDLVVFDYTQNPPSVLTKGIREGGERGMFKRRD